MINKIIDNYKDIPDLKIRKLRYKFNNLYILYLESICSGDKVSEFILKNVTNPNRIRSLNNMIASPNMKKISKIEIDNYLFSGFAIVCYLNDLYALETKADLDRGIDTPQIEPDLYGAKDAFIENYQKNIGLIKRRIKNRDLKIKEYKIGRYSNTTTGILYIDNITNKEYVDTCISLIKDINVDSIIDSGELKQYLIKKKKSFFPTIKLSEKPNTIVHALLAGKVVIVVDTSPFAIILPAVLADFINPVSDNYLYANNVNFIKILRFICLFLTIFTPALYIATANYNQETIPSNLLISFISQRQGVPFPSTVEALIMILICEILRESDLRFPSNYGSAISILGALIIGQAAVDASIVSPIMIIIVSLTFITSMIFNNIEVSGALRAWRFIALFMASIYGICGVFITFIFLLVNLSSTYSFNLSYTFPIAPLNINYIRETIFSARKDKQKFRSRFLTKNIRKQG